MSLIRRFQQFHLFEDGDIFEDLGRNGVERINAELFWKRIPEAARLALAKAAPPVAGPWIGEGTCFWREKQSSYNAATCVQFSNGVWRRDGSTTHFHSKEMAMDEADADLRAKGWCLDG